MSDYQKRIRTNSLKALLLLISGSLLFVSVITIFPLIGSFFLKDFPIWKVIQENFSLLLPLSVFSIFISPVLGVISTVFRYKRIVWLIIIGIISYWFAVLFVLLVFSNFSLLNESLYNVFILTIWAFLAYSIFSLPILIPVIVLFEKWTRPAFPNPLLQEGNSSISNTSDNRKTYNKPNIFIDYLIQMVTAKYQRIGMKMLAPTNGDSILEIGFGTGRNILEIAHQVGDTGKVTGIDISPEMCRITASKIKNAGLSSRLDILCQDASKFNFENKLFDSIFFSFSLDTFSDEEIQKILLKCLSILKKDGKIIIVYSSKEENNNAVLLQDWLCSAFPKLVENRPIQLTEKLVTCGFEIIEENQFSMLGLPVKITKAAKKD